jgi:hypothetical protein
MEMSISHIWQSYYNANGFKDFIQTLRLQVYHWMKTMFVILYAMKFSHANTERNLARPGG